MESLEAENVPLGPEDFTVLILCALEIEAHAVVAQFDKTYDSMNQHEKDGNTYEFGSMGKHSVVVAYMPKMGGTQAAIASALVNVSFPRVDLCLVVGICGVVPHYRRNGETHNVQLGDVMISEGLVHYQSGRQLEGRFEIRKDDIQAPIGEPKLEILSFLKKLREPNRLQTIKETAQSNLKIYDAPPHDEKYRRPYSQDDAESESQTNPLTDEPEVHFGLFASGEAVIKSAEYRDNLAGTENVIAFEMEGFGPWPTFPTLIIKSACDFADKNKHKGWQPYAAATAAAHAKAILSAWRFTKKVPSIGICIVTKQQIFYTNELKRLSREVPFSNSVTLPYYGLDDLTEVISSYDHLATHNHFTRRRTPGTCDWILELDEFKNWHSGSDKSVIWFHGPLGAGKTIAVSRVIDFLRTESAKDSRQIVYFYVDHAQTPFLSACSILESFSKQLLQTRQASGKDIPIDLISAVKLLCSKQVAISGAVRLEQIYELFTKLFSSFENATYVIDGLDELAEAEKRLIVALFQNLDIGAGGQKLFLASRTVVDKTIDLAAALDKPLQIHMTAQMNKADVGVYIETKFWENSKRSGHPLTEDDLLDKKIRDTLSTKTDGSFLWLSLQVEDIWCHTQTDAELDLAIDNLPRGLDEVYERSWARLSILDQLYTESVMLWIADATRPLTTNELREAISVQPGDEQLNFDRLVPQRQVIGSCGNLVFTDRYDSKIRFAHSSIREYFDRLGTFDVGRREKTMWKVCLTYMNFKELQGQTYYSANHSDSSILIKIPKSIAKPMGLPGLGHKLWDMTLKKEPKVESKTRQASPHVLFDFYADDGSSKPNELLEKYHFLKYARENWMNHTNEYERRVGPSKNDEWARLCLKLAIESPSPLSLPPWPQSSDLYGRVQNVLNWAARNGHAYLISILELLEDYEKIHKLLWTLTWEEDDQPPLHNAVWINDYDTVAELACNHTECRLCLDKQGRTAFFVAAKEGYYDIARLLADPLDGSLMFTHRDVSSLSTAIDRGDFRMRDFLLSRGA